MTTPTPKPEPKPIPGPGSVKLSAKLPKVHALNGLGTIHEQLAKFAGGYVIMFVESSEQTNRLGGGRQPLASIEQIEGLPTGPLADAGKELMLRARSARELTDGVIPGMDTDGLASKRDDTDEPYVEGAGNGAGWND